MNNIQIGAYFNDGHRKAMVLNIAMYREKRKIYSSLIWIGFYVVSMEIFNILIG